MSVLQKLTEGIVERSLQREGAALLDKWEATGLLEGLSDDNTKSGMARLLENQAAQLLKEASSMGAGDVEGFASVAFPIVRRVFGGLLANDLVSVQPMSLPSGLIFFMDFTYSDQTSDRMGVDANQSVYGGGVTGSQIQNGVSDIKESGGGFYNLANAYSSPTGSVGAASGEGLGIQTIHLTAGGKLVSALTDAEKKLIQYDPDLLANTTSKIQVLDCDFDSLTKINLNMVKAIQLQEVVANKIRVFDADASTDDMRTTTSIVRRLTQVLESTPGSGLDRIRVVLEDTNGDSVDKEGTALNTNDQLGVHSYPRLDGFVNGDAVGSVRGSNFPLEGATDTAGSNFNGSTVADQIPEIDIRV
ncbi:MAG: hypothetical protein CL554_21700, partial [Algoriphagus sp.]|uniref:hypothetical protein n=1 Tax=Algoriphagus sp. TaxID=1872435 RepID=UPI000C5BAE85